MLNCSIIRAQHIKLLFLDSDYAESDRKDKAFSRHCKIILTFSRRIVYFTAHYTIFAVIIKRFMKRTFTVLLVAATLFAGCGQKAQKIASIEAGCIEVQQQTRSDGAADIRAILAARGAAIDSIKAPVIGEAATELAAYPPESPLMNFAADALLTMARKASDRPVDIAITNKGGLRSTIQQGAITYGNIFSVFPFENTLALLTLDGEQLMQLFADIAKVGGEAISGARLTITADGKLTGATVGGKKIVPTRKYRIATSDYLSQGNDRLYTLGKGSEVEIKSGITIRDLMIEYIKDLDKKGKKISAATDGRITIK